MQRKMFFGFTVLGNEFFKTARLFKEYLTNKNLRTAPRIILN